MASGLRGYRFGDFELDLRAGELRKNGRRRRLPGRAFRALALLLENAGEVVTRQELRRAVWPDEVHVEFEHGLNNAVHRIRGALGDPALVETLPRRGYRFLGEVERVIDVERSRRPRLHRAGAAVVLLLVGALALVLSRRGLEHPDPDALEAYSRGSYFLAQKTPESVERSLAYFDEAVRRAPEFAPAHAGRARAFHFLGALGLLSPEEARSATQDAAEAALALDPRCGAALAVLAESRFRFWNEREEVEALFERALAADPGDAEARHWYGMFLAIEGRLEEGLAELKRAQRLDPLSLGINTDLGALLYEAGARELALEQLERTLELDPDYPKTHFLLGFVHLAEGDIDRAVTSFERTVTLSPRTPKYLAALVEALVKAGRKSDAKKTLAELRELADTRHVAPALLASLSSIVSAN